MSFQQWKISSDNFNMRMRLCYGSRSNIYHKCEEHSSLKSDLDLLRNVDIVKEADTCTAVLLHNLAEPEWITIDCDQKLFRDIVCIANEISQDKEVSINMLNKYHLCSLGSLKVKTICLQFEWKYFLDIVRDTNFKLTLGNRHSLRGHIQFLLANVKHNYMIPFYFGNYQNIVIIKKFFEIYNITEEKAKANSAAYFVHVYKIMDTIQSEKYMFECKHGVYILYTDMFYHDAKCKELDGNNITDIILLNNTKTCPQLFYLTSNRHCKIYISLKFVDSLDKHEEKEPTIFHYGHPGNSTIHQITDHKCMHKGELYCDMDQELCFNFSDICQYHLNEVHQLIPCPTGTNLYNCKPFECNKEFKCYLSYCVPWRYVCDGKWDCPQGFDELTSHGCGQNRECKNMLKCEGSQICIHLEDVCNGVVDCPYGNDEAEHCNWNIPLLS